MAKVYKLMWYDSFYGRLLSWAASRKEANIRKLEILKEYKNKPERYQHPVEITEIDIPTDKGGLARWLDKNFNWDNFLANSDNAKYND